MLSHGWARHLERREPSILEFESQRWRQHPRHTSSQSLWIGDVRDGHHELHRGVSAKLHHRAELVPLLRAAIVEPLSGLLVVQASPGARRVRRRGLAPLTIEPEWPGALQVIGPSPLNALAEADGAKWKLHRQRIDRAIIGR